MDYEKIGLKAGIEIHQRLATKHKLFCHCSTELQDKEPVFEIKRKLRPVAGETGAIDVAAAFEKNKDKVFSYKVYLNESCAVEMDSEPPHPLNREALKTALEIALLLKCTVPDEIQVMRKTVVDGSNTSGFQRTAVIGLNGHLKTSFGEVGILSVAVEEESCMILQRKKSGDIFGLNRLGIPLVEIATDPDAKTPEQVKELSEKLGLLLRSTGKVKRGLGTIRQDVNVSIRGGERVEIKGAQDLNLIPKLVTKEAERQLKIIKSRKKVSHDVRKPEKNGSTTFLRPLPGASRLYPETDIPPITVTKEFISEIQAILPELIDDKMKDIIKAYDLDANIAKIIAKDKPLLTLFEKLAKLRNVKPSFAADVLLSYQRTLPGDISKVTEKDIHKAFVALDKGLIEKKSVMELLADVSKGKGFDIDKYEISTQDEDLAFDIVQKVIEANPKALTTSRPENALMGLVMQENKGRFPGAMLIRILKEELSKRGK